MNSILWFQPTWPPSCYPCSMSLDEYLKMSSCHAYKPQLVEHVRKTSYRPYSVMPGGVPNTNKVHNVPRLPNSSAIYWGGQSIWTHPYEPQLTHSHRQHSPTRATTQEFLVFIHHLEPQLKRCHSYPQLKEYPTSWPLRYHQSLVNHAHPSEQITSPTSTLSPSRHVPPGAKRLWCHCFCRYRLAGQPLLPSATRSRFPLIS